MKNGRCRLHGEVPKRKRRARARYSKEDRLARAQFRVIERAGRLIGQLLKENRHRKRKLERIVELKVRLMLADEEYEALCGPESGQRD